ncbi:HAMP domain-containing histidine kinase [Schaalia sp. ZJ405]|uniref:HAMP domain-containing sensor histidine kinase n=1 Tax=unclassified Schaalia TaxID=2691889 RepID=UPI0013EA32AA|nr:MULTISPECIES: HAMP domain-containing sensor histidine kinase [unclassified Schaalia]QPK81684.1 HAMP domain-containing histidine kinase [Schaalia sp. ZJ405]
MRKRAVRIILVAVSVVALLMGIPGAVTSSLMLWGQAEQNLEARAMEIVRSLDRANQDGTVVTSALADAWSSARQDGAATVYAHLKAPDGGVIIVGEKPSFPTLSTLVTSATGSSVRLEISAIPTIQKIVIVCIMFAAGMVTCLLVGRLLASRLSRHLSAPLIYLAAQAEQIGSGQVRARVKPSGIEEIDLVSEELARTGERMAGRLAAERQFAADASHQLRTPLTALSMRLEEIEMISTEDAVQDEVRSCLEQVERMTTVVAELLDTSTRASGLTEAIHILEVFNTQREEWEEVFERAGRQLVFLDEAELPVLADSGKLGQVLATLIENSLHYGDGITRVHARRSANKRGVIIEVSDEGEGIDDDLAPDIFIKGVSGHGSTGIGLALAKDLTGAMGGRLDLTQNQPPIFTVSLAAIPASLDPDRVMPQGPVVSMGRRSRRF